MDNFTSSFHYLRLKKWIPFNDCDFGSRIVQEKGVSRIESYMYEDHPMLKRAAVQLINNLLFSDEVVKMFEGKNDRTKYLVLVCADDDLELVQAAIGGLAVLTALSKRASKKVFDVSFPTFQFNCFNHFLTLKIENFDFKNQNLDFFLT